MHPGKRQQNSDGSTTRTTVSLRAGATTRRRGKVPASDEAGGERIRGHFATLSIRFPFRPGGGDTFGNPYFSVRRMKSSVRQKRASSADHRIRTKNHHAHGWRPRCIFVLAVRLLDADGAKNGVNRVKKAGQYPVAGLAQQASLLLFDERYGQFHVAAQRTQLLIRRGVGPRDKSADHIICRFHFGHAIWAPRRLMWKKQRR